VPAARQGDERAVFQDERHGTTFPFTGPGDPPQAWDGRGSGRTSRRAVRVIVGQGPQCELSRPAARRSRILTPRGPRNHRPRDDDHASHVLRPKNLPVPTRMAYEDTRPDNNESGTDWADGDGAAMRRSTPRRRHRPPNNRALMLPDGASKVKSRAWPCRETAAPEANAALRGSAAAGAWAGTRGSGLLSRAARLNLRSLGRRRR